MGNCLAPAPHEELILEHKVPLMQTHDFPPEISEEGTFSGEFDPRGVWCRSEAAENAKATTRAMTNHPVRIKMVISKEELREMLEKGMVSSVGEMVAQLQRKVCMSEAEDREGGGRCMGWRPVLESIPEVN